MSVDYEFQMGQKLAQAELRLCAEWRVSYEDVGIFRYLAIFIPQKFPIYGERHEPGAAPTSPLPVFRVPREAVEFVTLDFYTGVLQIGAVGQERVDAKIAEQQSIL